MKTALALLGLFVPALAWPSGRPAPSDYTNGEYGFRLTPPAFPKLESGASVAAVFLAPPETNFSANVNVTVQSQSMSLAQYRETTLAEMAKSSLRVNAESSLKVSGRDALRIDYEGTLQNRKMRWLALAILEKDRVILVTCTALKDTYEHYAKEFQACLDSFKLAE